MDGLGNCGLDDNVVRGNNVSILVYVSILLTTQSNRLIVKISYQPSHGDIETFEREQSRNVSSLQNMWIREKKPLIWLQAFQWIRSIGLVAQLPPKNKIRVFRSLSLKKLLKDICSALLLILNNVRCHH